MEENKETEIQEKKEKEQIKRSNVLLRNILITVVLAVIVFFIFKNPFAAPEQTFQYKGIDFEIVNEVAPYRTSIMVNQVDSVTGAATQVPYYYYIRTDPRELGKIPFEGQLVLMKDMVVNATDPFYCDGKGLLGMTNLARLLGSIGVDVIKDPEAGCDPENRYMFLNIEVGNETKIVKTSDSCYVMYVKDCEVLEATERFMLETFVAVKNLPNNSNGDGN